MNSVSTVDEGRNIQISKKIVLLLFFFFLFPVLFFGQILQTFTSSGTWVCPTGVTSITVECWGGGGAGGGSVTVISPNAGAGGGGGGYTKTNSVSVTPGNTYNVTVGQGGSGNQPFTVTGNNGGNSYFGSNIGLAYGGNGGGGNGGSLGTGGTGGTWNGGSGGAAKNATTSGGGGGGAGYASNGGNGNQNTPGSGGTGNSSGSGGAGLSSNADGNPGNSIGGGGSGAGQSVGFQSWTGGSGANGEVIITNTTPPAITTLSSNICAGGSITITGINFTGITTGNVTIGGVAVSSITSFTSTQIVAVVNAACSGNVKVTTVNGTATSAGTFTSTAPPSATISYGGSPYCKSVGTAQSVTLSGTTGGSYSASPTGLTINSSTGAITPSSSTAGTYTVTYTMAASGGCSAQTVTTSVIITAIPSATITYGGTPFCKSIGTAQSVTLSGTTGGTYSASPTGLTINSSTGAITPSSSTAGTYTVTYTMAASGGCSAQITTTSIAITTLPLATISYSGTPFCQSLGFGQAVTQTGTNGGSYSASPSGLTINSSTGAITPSSSTAGTYTVTYTMAASGGCSAQTTTTSVIINATPAAPTVTTPINYCLNAAASQLTATGTNLTWGSGSISGTAGGSSVLTTGTYVSNSYSNKETDFTTTAANVEITTVNYYIPAYQSVSGLQLALYNSSGTVIATSSNITTLNNNVSTTAVISNTFNYTISVAGNYSIGVAAGTGTVGGDSPIFPITEPTGTINITGTNNLGSAPYHCFNNIQFTANNGSVAPTPSTSTADTTNYLVSQTVNGCVSPQATIAIIVSPFSVGGSVNSNVNVCSGTNSGTVYLTGQTGNVVKWQSSTDGGTTWTDIANTTTSQAYSNLAQTTMGRAVAQSGVCASVNSSPVTITVNSVSVGGTVNSSATVCSGINTGTVYLTGQTGNVVEWQSSTDGGSTWTNIVNTTSSQTYSNITLTTQYRAVVQSGVCSSANSNAATVTVNPVSVGGAVNSNATVCSGTNSGTLTLTGNTGSVVKWQSSADGGTTWTDIANTTTSQTYTNITLTTQYRAVVQSGVCSTANSSAATITVNSVSVGGNVNSSSTACSGTNSGTVYLTGQTGNVVKWQSSTDGGTTWTDIANTTTSLLYSNLTQTTQYLAVVQSGVCSSANSSAATITVNSVSVGGAVNSNATVCSGSNSGTVYLTGQTGNVVKWQSSTDGGSTWADIANTTTSQTYSNLAQTTMGRAVVQSGVCASVNSNPVTITVEPTGSWTGSVSTDWNDTRNWICGLLPTSAINVTIPGGASNYPVISSGIDDANNIIIASGGSLTVGSGTLQISGAISNSGTFDATAGTIEMKGASAQTIDGNSFYNNTINNLIVSNTGSGLSVSSTTSDTLKITGTLTFGNSGSTLYTGDNITLVSNSAGTASVGIVGSGNTINGNVTVERYINVGTAAGQHAKSWQFLATPTIGQTVKQSWMENGATPVGYGTQITGTGTGFDATTSAPSLKYYNPATNAWVGVTNTNNSIYNPEGYMVFVRGDRSVTSVSQPANTTTLRTKGALLTGTLTPISVNPDEYASIGNPYASPVDFTLITKGAAIDDQFYVWDPYLYGSYGVGGYQTLSSANEFKPVPGGTSAYPSGTPYYILQSGQAIFVHSTSNPSYTAPDYNLTFSENSKSNSTSANFSRMSGLTPPPSSRAFFGVSLYTGNTIADGNTVAFDRSFSDNVDGNDALKLINGGENFGLKRDGKLLAIEARSPAVVTDTLYYYMTNLQQKAYQLRFAPVNMVASGLQAFLVDNFLNTSTPVSLSDSSFINITVTSNPASSASGRFDVVFRTLSITPVTFTSISAVQKNADIEVDWSVENETGIRQYEVEESGDGNQFTQVATVAPQNNGSGNYSWLDVNVTPGYHYYRVRSVGMDGQVQYTQIVKVLIGKMDASFSVYPNPIVNGNIHLAFNNEPAGVYGVRLMNSLGQLIFLKIINHGGGNSMEEITPSQTLAKGIYQLEITKPDGNVEVVKVIN